MTLVDGIMVLSIFGAFGYAIMLKLRNKNPERFDEWAAKFKSKPKEIIVGATEQSQQTWNQDRNIL